MKCDDKQWGEDISGARPVSMDERPRANHRIGLRPTSYFGMQGAAVACLNHLDPDNGSAGS